MKDLKRTQWENIFPATTETRTWLQKTTSVRPTEILKCSCKKNHTTRGPATKPHTASHSLFSDETFIKSEYDISMFTGGRLKEFCLKKMEIINL